MAGQCASMTISAGDWPVKAKTLGRKALAADSGRNRSPLVSPSLAEDLRSKVEELVAGKTGQEVVGGGTPGIRDLETRGGECDVTGIDAVCCFPRKTIAQRSRETVGEDGRLLRGCELPERFELLLIAVLGEPGDRQLILNAFEGFCCLGILYVADDGHIVTEGNIQAVAADLVGKNTQRAVSLRPQQ